MGALRRTLKYFGRTRPDVGDNCPEKFDFEFYMFIWNFNRNNREKFIDMLDNAVDKQIYVFKSRHQCDEFLERL